MPTFRAYLNKKKGNEHSRVFDADALTEEEFRNVLKREISPNEVLDQVQTLYTETTADFEGIVYRVADEFEKRGMTREDAVALATSTVLRDAG